jgi:hypothetical protein
MTQKPEEEEAQEHASEQDVKEVCEKESKQEMTEEEYEQSIQKEEPITPPHFVPEVQKENVKISPRDVSITFEKINSRRNRYLIDLVNSFCSYLISNLTY